MADTGKLEGLPQHPRNIPSSKQASAIGQTHPKPTGDRPSTDTVGLSPENADYQRLLKQIEQIPDIRHERVERIRRALESETYHIDSDRLSGRLLQETLLNALTTNQSPDFSPPPLTLPNGHNPSR